MLKIVKILAWDENDIAADMSAFSKKVPVKLLILVYLVLKLRLQVNVMIITFY